jgi:alkyl hydroperoxide reductase subunit AhpC
MKSSKRVTRPSLTPRTTGRNNDQLLRMLHALELGFNRNNHRASLAIVKAIATKVCLNSIFLR